MSTFTSVEIIEAKDFAIENLGFRFPINANAFLKERARVLKEHHPDKGAETDSEKFSKIISVLDIIKSNLDKLNGFVALKDRTVDGTLLATLGRGFTDGIPRNTVSCPRCNHHGYTTSKNPIFGIKKDFCDCDNGFIHTAVCRHCDPDNLGKYKLKSGKLVECKSCGGTGVHVYKTPLVCPKCRNRRHRLFGLLFGFEEIIGYEDAHYKCGHCDGRGEVIIHNPVITKAAIGGNNKRQKGNNIAVTANANMVKHLDKVMRSMR